MKRIIAIVLSAIMICTATALPVYAAEPVHWAKPYIDKMEKLGVVEDLFLPEDPDMPIAGNVFKQMLQRVAAGDTSPLPYPEDADVLSRYKAIEILSRYLTAEYYEDEVLQGRQKYMTPGEMYKIASYQKISIEYVLDFTVVYSCGIFSSGQCAGERELTYGEACAIMCRLSEYEEIQQNNPRELDRFYTMHCTCRLSGEHD